MPPWTFKVDDVPIYPGPNDRGRSILAAGWPQFLLGVIFVGTRTYFAELHMRQLRWDCIWALVALALGTGSHVCLVLAVDNGIGWHMYDLSGFQQAGIALEWYWMCVMLYIWATAIAKASICALFLSVWCPWQRKRRILLHTVWISNIVLQAAQTGISMSQCTPTRRIWDYSIKEGNCDVRPFALKFGYFQGAWSASSDIVLALYPILIMQDIKADLKTKVGFCVLMGGGFVSAAAAIVRTYEWKIVASSKDTTWAVSNVVIAGAAELWMIIVLGSIPPLRPQFTALLVKIGLYKGDPTQDAIKHSRVTVRSGSVRVKPAKGMCETVDELEFGDAGGLVATFSGKH